MQRWKIEVTGTVQGVGFRPFVYGVATRLGLTGFVRNSNGLVEIDAEGAPAALQQLLDAVQTAPPPLARVEQVRRTSLAPLGRRRFEIVASQTSGAADPRISPDIATCDDCIHELFDPGNRRYRYPFINCTNCGPRLTIIFGAPYDRRLTTMAGFEMCDDCRKEYDDPANRRFHAQPVACARCGPRLSLVDSTGRQQSGDPIGSAVAALRSGRIVAIKGIGGFHLACDAANAAAVRELRLRKRRYEKPLALMLADCAQADAFCELDPPERELLRSPARPIVLLRRRRDCPLPEDLAPINPWLGVMLAYTPVHHLLLREMGTVPLVMTSGNRSDEPIAYQDADAFARLGDIADLFLCNDRGIHVRCDDSVTRMIDRVESPIRRSRGYAPQPLATPVRFKMPLLATGGQLKSTFAFGHDQRATISHHLGDLDHFEAYRAFERDISLYEHLFNLRPEALICDLHPDYASTRYAGRRGASDGIRCVAVQHHHAHMASCMAEHGLNEPVIGVCFDGTGYGTDGAIWGGEFLVGDYASFRRAAHLRYVPAPGGDKAIREPWRMALAHLRDAGLDPSLLSNRIGAEAMQIVDHMLRAGLNSPLTSSVGRLFDAVACLLGIRDIVSFEAQAAMQLEWLAEQAPAQRGYPIDPHEPSEPDARPIVRAVVEDLTASVPPAVIAHRFHATIADLIRDTCQWIHRDTQLNTIVLSGGVFLNALLTRQATDRLVAAGFRVLRHRLVPTNDGGISLGQLMVGNALLG